MNTLNDIQIENQKFDNNIIISHKTSTTYNPLTHEEKMRGI